jgi:hypothetical protein
MDKSEFIKKLEFFKGAFKKKYGKDMTSIKELEDFLLGNQLKMLKRSRGAKSLKGLDL